MVGIAFYTGLLWDVMLMRICCTGFLPVLYFIAAASAQSLVFPPYLHSYGIRKAGPAQLFMFFGPRTFFDNPQGLATAKMVSRDNPSTEADDDEVVVYGVNAGRHELIYNTSMWTLALYGSQGSGKDQFLHPRGIACDCRGNVFVADSGNRRIVHLYNPKREVQWVKAFSGEGESSLAAPSQVALDEGGRVYVADPGSQRIVVFDSSGAVIRRIPETRTEFAFSGGPTALAVADGFQYWSYYKKERVIFCADSAGARIWKIDFNGKPLKTVSLPRGHRAMYAAIDYYHNLWLTDKNNHCILKYDHELTLLDIFGSYGTGDNQFVEPRGIAIWKRYGQTFIAEKTGAQYYWIGTSLKAWSVQNTGTPRMKTLVTELTEYSYISLFHAMGVDTAYFLKKRMVFPGKQTVDFGIAGDQAGQTVGAILRVEPTYSSYTYYHSDYPVNLTR